MTERDPSDSTLLSLSRDATTGVEYIPTGKSPYHLDFRRMLHRLLRACERANDLRPYQDGDLSIGIRPGRVRIGNNVIVFSGTSGIAIAADATVHAWLDATGSVQTGATGLPSDRTTCAPLAEIVTDASAIQRITDLRGEGFHTIAHLNTLNVSASADEINQALDGISENVTASTLSFMTGGGMNTADALHRHVRSRQVVDGEASFELINDSTSTATNMALAFSLPQHLPTDTSLLVNIDNGFFQQRYDGSSYNLLGTVQPQYVHGGELTASLTDRLLGSAPVTGVVTDVILSIADNIVSGDSEDGIRATVKVNGTALTSVDPALTSADGPGFVSTAQGHGTTATIKSDTTEQVQRGDILTVDLTRIANGTITTDPRDVVVLVVIRAAGPE